MADYWTSFKGFVPDPNATFKQEFERLARHRGWAKGKSRWQTERVKALNADFDDLYGSASKLQTWQILCREVGIDPAPGSITKCKAILGSGRLMVNIYDLVDARRTGTPVRLFNSRQAFVNYTKNGRMFPREQAKKDGFISALLRIIV